MAGTAQGYERYSQGLKVGGFEWNDAALNSWLENPSVMIPDTYMVFERISDAAVRADLIAFLQIAGKAGGGEQAVTDGLIPAAWLHGAAPDPIGYAQPEARVTEIRHCGDSFFIKTEAGTVTPFWEKNVRLKIDSVETGPPPGAPVILGAGEGHMYTPQKYPRGNLDVHGRRRTLITRNIGNFVEIQRVRRIRALLRSRRWRRRPLSHEPRKNLKNNRLAPAALYCTNKNTIEI